MTLSIIVLISMGYLVCSGLVLLDDILGFARYPSTMPKVFGQDDPLIAQYVEDLLKPEDQVLKEVREYSAAQKLPQIQLGPMDALHLEVLVRISGAKKAVEIGTLGGYSGIAICRGMGGSGKLHTFELQKHNAQVARRNFEQAGVSNQVEIHVGPALDMLPSVEKEGPFDLVFIDADKSGYSKYLEWARRNLRTGGVVLADNTFGWGKVPEGSQLEGERRQSRRTHNNDDTNAIRGLREFNKLVASPGSGFRATMLPTGEGLTLAVKI